MPRLGILATAFLLSGLVGEAQRPVFTGEPSDLVRLDVQVVSSDGDPIRGLSAADFLVEFNGTGRPVVVSAFVQAARDVDQPGLGVVRAPGKIAPDERIFVLALDEPGFSAGLPAVIGPQLQRFAHRLESRDILGVYPFSYGLAPLRLTHERALASPLLRFVGRAEPPTGDFRLSSSEIVDITAGDDEALHAVSAALCSAGDMSCQMAVRSEALARAGALEADGARRLSVLQQLVRSLSGLPGRKHLVLLSGGLPSAIRPGARPDLSSSITAMSDLVTGTDVLLYTVHWVDTPGQLAWPARNHRRAMADREADGAGLERLARQSNGASFQINSEANADAVFDRILRETSAHYVLGVQPRPDDRDGRSRSLRIGVNRQGAIVRSRTKMQLPVR
jgi:VWFA-related protein